MVIFLNTIIPIEVVMIVKVRSASRSKSILPQSRLPVVSILTASTQKLKGLTLATDFIQLGMKAVGKRALLMNIRGRLIKLTKAKKVS